MHLHNVLALCVLSVLSSASAFADTFNYSFSDTGNFTSALSFTYLSPVLITTDTSFVPLTCTYVGDYVCTSIEVDPVSTYITFNVDFFDNGLPSGTGSTSDPFFGNFNQLGTQSAYGQTLTITKNIGPVSLTPEPSSLALLGTGVLGALAAARRRFCQAG